VWLSTAKGRGSAARKREGEGCTVSSAKTSSGGTLGRKDIQADAHSES